MNKLLKSILSTPSHSGHCDRMAALITEHAKSNNYQSWKDDAGNVYVVRGVAEFYPCVVAHMDTVHRIEKGGITPIEINGCITGINPRTITQTGIGGDDKCGIYAALRCLRYVGACKAAFFVDEEVGCKGSGLADVEFFANCRFVLQADRRGSADWVTDICGPLGSEEFQKAVAPYLEKFGFKESDGMMSDVMALRDNLIGISVANMSAGYYNPHQDNEFIDPVDLENTTNLMIALCRELNQRFPYEWDESQYMQKWTTITPAKHYGVSPYGSYGGPVQINQPMSIQDAWEAEQQFYGGRTQTGFEKDEPRPGEGICYECQEIKPIDDLDAFGLGYYVCKQCLEEALGRSGKMER